MTDLTKIIAGMQQAAATGIEDLEKSVAQDKLLANLVDCCAKADGLSVEEALIVMAKVLGMAISRAPNIGEQQRTVLTAKCMGNMLMAINTTRKSGDLDELQQLAATLVATADDHNPSEAERIEQITNLANIIAGLAIDGSKMIRITKFPDFSQQDLLKAITLAAGSVTASICRSLDLSPAETEHMLDITCRCLKTATYELQKRT